MLAKVAPLRVFGRAPRAITVVAALVLILAVGTAAMSSCGPAPHLQCTSQRSGSLGPYSFAPKIVNSNGYNTYVGNNMWSSNAGSTQTVCGSDPAHLFVSAHMQPTNYTGVQTY